MKAQTATGEDTAGTTNAKADGADLNLEEEDKRIVVVYGSQNEPMNGELLDNIMMRIAERSTVLSYFVDINQWLWVNVRTVPQANNCQIN